MSETGTTDSQATVTRALTVRQPWASLLVSGAKDIENRTWPTSYRGRIAVHAGAAADPSAPYPAGGPRSAIVGTVEITGCVRDSGSAWAEQDSWHWELANAVMFSEPVPVSGKLGLWKLDEQTARAVAEAR